MKVALTKNFINGTLIAFMFSDSKTHPELATPIFGEVDHFCRGGEVCVNL